MITRLFTIVLAISVSIGCTSTYKAERPAGQTAPHLEQGQCSIYVSVPQDGSYADRHGKGSGVTTAQSVVNAFLPYVTRAERGEAPESNEVALSHAAAGNFTHYVEPTILNWEDRATEWSGKSDAISIRLVLVEVPSRKQIDTMIIHGKSKWASFGGDHPQDLLAAPMARYSKELFGELAK